MTPTAGVSAEMKGGMGYIGSHTAVVFIEAGHDVVLYDNLFGNDYETKDGTGVRDYIHVMDLVEGHKSVVEFLNNCSGWHAINLGTGTGYSVLEMVQVFEQATGKVIPYRVSNRRVEDIATCYAKVDYSRQQLGWRTERGLNEMCRSTWNFQSGITR